MENYSTRLLKQVNSVIVTSDEIELVLEECNSRHEAGQAEGEEGLYVIVEKFHKQPERAKAICFRMVALSKIIEKKEALGWTISSDKPGAVLTKRELIEAAAIYPLSEIDGDVGFEIDGFLSKALELAEVEGTG